MSGLPLSDRPNRLLYTGENRIVETMERVKGTKLSSPPVRLCSHIYMFINI
jgi:hypothetical protein